MEATVIDFILSTLMSLSAQYPDAAWLAVAMSVLMTVCGLCAVATAWMPVPKETAGLYAVFYRWAHVPCPGSVFCFPSSQRRTGKSFPAINATPWPCPWGRVRFP